MVLTTYTGLTVAEMAELRRHLGKGLHYKVIKNTLAKKASTDTQFASAQGYFKGQVGIAIGYDDAVTTVKKVIEFSKKNAKLKLSIGVLEGRIFTAKELSEVAELPPRQVLLSMFAGVLQAPLSKLAYGLSQTVGGLSNAMNALKDKKE